MLLFRIERFRFPHPRDPAARLACAVELHHDPATDAFTVVVANLPDGYSWPQLEPTLAPAVIRALDLAEPDHHGRLRWSGAAENSRA